jgi:hypothetical protein
MDDHFLYYNGANRNEGVSDWEVNVIMCVNCVPEQNAIIQSTFSVQEWIRQRTEYKASHLRPTVAEPTAHPDCAIVIGRPLVNSSYLVLTGREPNTLSRWHISQQ